MAESENEGENMEMFSFNLIASAGNARSCSFNALSAAREGDFEAADAAMEEAEKSALEAHEQQTKLLVQEANGNHVPVDVMLVHAQDHLMTSMLARELAAEIVDLRRELVEAGVLTPKTDDEE